MNKFLLNITTSQIDEYCFETYGISVKIKNNIIREIFDITINRDELMELIDICNSKDLALIHLDEVIENFLYDCSNY